MWTCNCFENFVYPVIAWLTEAQWWRQVTLKYCCLERGLIFDMFFQSVIMVSRFFIPHIAVLSYLARTSLQSFEASHSEEKYSQGKRDVLPFLLDLIYSKYMYTYETHYLLHYSLQSSFKFLNISVKWEAHCSCHYQEVKDSVWTILVISMICTQQW